MNRIGFIGLGIMGRPMSKNLMKAGYRLVICELNPDTVNEFRGLGAEIAENPAGVAEKCDLIITMLPNSPQVRQVALGKNGLIEAAKPGTVIIDMSSIDPMESKAIGAQLAEKGIEFMDAPVSGGEPKAIDGTLSVMVGGKKELFDKHCELLKNMAASVVHVGELGAGNIAKLANQMVVAINIAAVSEALTFAQKAGASPEKVYQAIRGGLAGSTVMDAKAPLMLDRKFDPGFRIELHIKDLTNALNASHSIHSPAPLTGQLMEIMQYLAAHGHEKEDHGSIVKYYESISGIELERDQK